MTALLRLESTQAHRVEMRGADLWVETATRGQYSDLDSEAEHALIEELKVTPWRTAVTHRFAESSPWLYKIITDRGRPVFLDFLGVPDGGSCLDVGSGWGQVAIPLSKRARVFCLDITLSRLEILRQIARQEAADLLYVCGNFRTFPFAENQFALVVFNGSLEWLALGSNGQSIWDVQCAALKKAQRILSPGGLVYIGIENSLGLKYLLGAPDDHTGISNLTFRDEAAAKDLCAQNNLQLRAKTWSLGEYGTLLDQAGLRVREIFGCFPDYKLIRHMIPIQDVDAVLAESGMPYPEHSGSDGAPLPHATCDNLEHLYRLLARNGIARYFCPSYAVIAEKRR